MIDFNSLNELRQQNIVHIIVKTMRSKISIFFFNCEEILSDINLYITTENCKFSRQVTQRNFF